MNTPALISVLTQCAHACTRCASACISEDQPSRLKKCILTDLDCADQCILLMKAVSRESSLIRVLIKTCIEVCEACEKECNKHDHEHCRECAKACRECISACKDHLQTLENA